MEKVRIENITSEGNHINILRLNHPKCVSDFLRHIKDIRWKGYEEVSISCNATAFFPNACVPISGIIQHYKRQGISFQFESNGNYLDKCRLYEPYSYHDEDNLELAYAFPLDKIYRFTSNKQVAMLSQSYVNAISSLEECESGVLDSINWCINEVMDNVLTHSQTDEGYVMAQFHPGTKHIAFCVYDSGIGIFNTLKKSKHHPIKEIDALTLAIQEGVGDGKGQGNGLYGLFESVQSNNGILSITSGQSSIMLTDAGTINKYEYIPCLGKSNSQTTVDFQINLQREIDFKSIFSSISSGFEPFDARIDEMLSETDELVHYDVYYNSQGTGTRDAGSRLRNDVINIIKRENRALILDFGHVHTVSSSFIDEFLAKMVIRLGFVSFNKLIKIANMNETVSLLFERSLYMRVSEEWNNRKKSISDSEDSDY